MIDKKIYDLDYIRELQARYKTDPGLLERVLYAFGLLEALVKVGMKFTFKGGTSLMLLLDHPIRLSTDIDIIVDPGTDVESYIEQAGTIFPFLRKEEDIRKGRNNIEKRHFKSKRTDYAVSVVPRQRFRYPSAKIYTECLNIFSIEKIVI